MTDLRPTSLTQVLAFLIFGLWVGAACGLGMAHSEVVAIALAKPRIDGNIVIYDNGKPITISGFYMEVDGCGPAIEVKTPQEGRQ